MSNMDISIDCAKHDYCKNRILDEYDVISHFAAGRRMGNENCSRGK